MVIRLAILFSCFHFALHAQNTTPPVNALLNDAAGAFRGNNLHSALDFALKADSLAKVTNDIAGMIKARNALYFIEINTNDDINSYLYASSAYELATAALERCHPLYKMSLNNYSVFLSELGNHRESLDLKYELLALTDSCNNATDRELMMYHQNIAVSLNQIGNHDKALDFLDAASAIMKRTDVPLTDSLNLLSQLATSSYYASRFDDCKYWSIKSINLINKRKMTSGRTRELIANMIDMSECLVSENKPDSAEIWIRTSLLLQDTFRYLIDRSYRLLSKIHLQRGDTVRGVDFCRRAVKEAEIRLAETSNSGILSDTYFDMAECFLYVHLPDSATYFFEKALTELVLDTSTRIYSVSNITHHERAGSIAVELLANYNNKRKVRYSKEDLFRILWDCLKYEMIQDGDSKYMLKMVNDMHVFLENLIGRFISGEIIADQNELKKLMFTLDFNKTRILANQIRQNSLVAESDQLSLLNRFREQRSFILLLDKLMLSQNENGSKFQEFEDQRFAATKKLDSLRLVLRRNHPGFYNISLGESDIISDGNYKRSHCVLQYFQGPTRTFVFVSTGGQVLLKEIEWGSREETELVNLITCVSMLSAHIDSFTETYDKYVTAASHLFERIVPVELMPLGLEKLIIIPDGKLRAIPFEVLLTSEEDSETPNYFTLPYLLKEVDIQYLYSARLAQLERHNKPKINEILAFAPEYEGVLGSDRAFGKLFYNTKELESIEKYFPGKYLVGADAVKESFLKLAPEYNVLHLASHAMADNEHPELSRLFFTGVEKDSVIATLYPYEIQSIPIHASMAVLSACQSGVGKLHRGEGVFSLARDFIAAGARSVVNSLWKVDDIATSQIMEKFYANLKKGMTKSAALRKAKLDFLEDADSMTSHPYFWASFVVIGDDDPIVTNGKKCNWIFGGLILISTFTFLSYRTRRRKKQGEQAA